MDLSLCGAVILIIAAALAIYGFMEILKEKQKHENNTEQIQRQLRGFGMLLLSEVILLIGMGLCLGLGGGIGGIQSAILSL